MIETYKILNNKYDEDVSNFLSLHKDKIQGSVWGHTKKLLKRRHTYLLRKNSVRYRMVDRSCNAILAIFPWMLHSLFYSWSKFTNKGVNETWLCCSLCYPYNSSVKIHMTPEYFVTVVKLSHCMRYNASKFYTKTEPPMKITKAKETMKIWPSRSDDLRPE